MADYPFTTLHPNLGVCYTAGQEFVIADIPGLIEGASEGAGLGTRFLGHVERCGVLLHLIDGTDYDNVAAHYRTIRHELQEYGDGLADKPEIIAISKTDALIPEIVDELKDVLSAESGQSCDDIFAISSVARDGLEPVLKKMLGYALEARSARHAEMAVEAGEDQDPASGTEPPMVMEVRRSRRSADGAPDRQRVFKSLFPWRGIAVGRGPSA